MTGSFGSIIGATGQGCAPAQALPCQGEAGREQGQSAQFQQTARTWRQLASQPVLLMARHRHEQEREACQ
jgi:hypothetical protein